MLQTCLGLILRDHLKASTSKPAQAPNYFQRQVLVGGCFWEGRTDAMPSPRCLPTTSRDLGACGDKIPGVSSWPLESNGFGPAGPGVKVLWHRSKVAPCQGAVAILVAWPLHPMPTQFGPEGPQDALQCCFHTLPLRRSCVELTPQHIRKERHDERPSCTSRSAPTTLCPERAVLAAEPQEQPRVCLHEVLT